MEIFEVSFVTVLSSLASGREQGSYGQVVLWYCGIVEEELLLKTSMTVVDGIDEIDRHTSLDTS